MKKTLWTVAVGTAMLAAAAFAAEPGEDPTLAYSDTVQDIVARFNQKLIESQPYLVWPGADLDQDERDKIAWKLEVLIGDLRDMQFELDSLAVPEGFDEAHKLISGAFGLYMTALSRCGTGIQRDYVKTFNGGVQDYNAAGTYLDSGFGELEASLRRAGYAID
ncbi:MAG: hypothetical protein JSU81_10695 [Candidatus Coatesbacteria bacterium]|nr:MAG: hypothetical protein JSU81_10695 [Candidatus Coatesbacteria bacterium]